MKIHGAENLSHFRVYMSARAAYETSKSLCGLEVTPNNAVSLKQRKKITCKNCIKSAHILLDYRKDGLPVGYKLVEHLSYSMDMPHFEVCDDIAVVMADIRKKKTGHFEIKIEYYPNSC